VVSLDSEALVGLSQFSKEWFQHLWITDRLNDNIYRPHKFWAELFSDLFGLQPLVPLQEDPQDIWVLVKKFHEYFRTEVRMGRRHTLPRGLDPLNCALHEAYVSGVCVNLFLGHLGQIFFEIGGCRLVFHRRLEDGLCDVLGDRLLVVVRYHISRHLAD